MKRFHANVGARALARRNGVLPPLYEFTSATFTSAGVTGRTGPNLIQCKDAYSLAGYSWAATYLDMTTQGYQLWTVPQTGNYVVRCAGASISSLSANTGFGKGIVIETTVNLTRGDQIQLLVGQSGTPTAAQTESPGGGGGSFVASGVTPATGVCIVAAGGGGSNNRGTNGSGNSVQNAVATTSGAAGSQNSSGTAGSGGDSGGYNGCAGGGFIGDGTVNGGGDSAFNVAKGISFRNGGVGGDYHLGTSGGGYGGFGGGGGGGSGSYPSPGGGGYSGGAGGVSNSFGGCGGGSFPSGVTTIGMNTGDGYITITAV